MDLMILLTYTAICIAVFKVFKIPLNKWSVPTAALGGILIISTLIFLMNYNHPYAKYSKEIFTVIPIVPQITGTVKTVDVVANKLVTKGTLLFSLENEAQTIAVAKAKANFVQAKSEVLQNSAALNQAIARSEKTRADRDRSKTTYLRYKEGHESGGDSSPFSQQQVDTRKKLYEANEAELKSVVANEMRLRLVTESKILGENTLVAQLKASLDQAELDLSRTYVYAPVDGMPTQLTIRPGVRATSFPLRPVISFIPKEKRRIAAAFWQNSLLRLEVGLDAEVILDSVPGHVFKGKVVDILPGMAEGEIQSYGTLIAARDLQRSGFAIGIIELEENLSDYNLPLGVQGQAVALNYEHDILHVSIMRRVALRMMAWLKYIYPVK